MTTQKILASFERVKIPLPDYFRPADISRLQKALKQRTIYGYTNPQLDAKNFSVVDPALCTHTFTNFSENGERMIATLNILDTPAGNELLTKLMEEMTSHQAFVVKRRMNNDPWKFEGKLDHAPGFFAIDLKIGV